MKKRRFRVFIFICFGVLIALYGYSEQNSKEISESHSVQKKIEGSDTKYEIVKKQITALKDENSNVREEAAEILGRMCDPLAVEPLIIVLQKDDVWNVRKWAAWALGEIRDNRAVEPLIEALNHKDWIIRFEAAKALGKIKDRRAVEPLIDVLSDESHYVRIRAAWALGEIKDSQAIESLIESMENKYPKVRSNAAIALGKIRNSNAVEPLIAVLKTDKVQSIIRLKDYEGLEFKTQHIMACGSFITKDNWYDEENTGGSMWTNRKNIEQDCKVIGNIGDVFYQKVKNGV